MTDDSLHLVVAKDPCYPGCYYYTDSCFRNDCKYRVAQMKSESKGVCPPATSPNNERNSVPSTADRVNEYHQNLSEFRTLQSLVSIPRFNADHYPDVCIRLKELSQKLKDEADALWDLHINVY